MTLTIDVRANEKFNRSAWAARGDSDCDRYPRTDFSVSENQYPCQYVRRVSLADGTPLVLRPIRADDEPMWRELLARCSEDTIWHRFGYLFKSTTHEMAQRFCAIDYQQSMAIVAEVVEGGVPKLVGVARLVADAEHRTAEYALLVDDAWQRRGLGTLLTHYCLEICRTWNIEEVIAETTADNSRMQRILTKEGFVLKQPVRNELLFQRHLGAPNCSTLTHCVIES
jgi:acetyltransferase